MIFEDVPPIIRQHRKGFTQVEACWVRGYIERKFGTNSMWPNEKQRQASRVAFELISTGRTEAREIRLWCLSWLSPAQWGSLKSSLRAWRHYQAKKGVQKKRITVDYDAWLFLTTLAKSNELTISEFLTDRFGDEYREREKKRNAKGK